jgi:hypothetical protein
MIATRTLLMPLAVFVVSAQAATAQNYSPPNCSAGFATQDSVDTSNTCSGTNPHEAVTDQVWYETNADTYCKDGGWVTLWWPPHEQPVGVSGECGHAAGGDRPDCTGIWGYPVDQGFNADTQQEIIAVSVYPQEWSSANGGTCYDDPAFDGTVYINTPSGDCMYADCCSDQRRPECEAAQGDFNQANCECNFATPLLIDMNGDGYQLTSFEDGIDFDLMGTGEARHIAWTASGTDDAFLVLDLNGNGVVDDGSELFGYRKASDGKRLNGFDVLASYDDNHDGQITAADKVFTQLQVWTDRNHNGKSEPSELKHLWEVGITSISVQYQSSERKDKFGNVLKLRSTVVVLEGKPREIVDVYFMMSPSRPSSHR